MVGKRKSRAADTAGTEPDAAELGLVAQRQKTAAVGGEIAVAVPKANALQAFKPGAHNRTSSLDAPIMLLEGHEAGVHCVKFSPDGSTVATAGADKLLHLWNVRGDCEVRARLAPVSRPRNPTLLARAPLPAFPPTPLILPAPLCPPQNYMMLQGHKNAILDLRWTADGENLVTCSPDKTVRCWDAHVGEQVKQMKGHAGFVNACDAAPTGAPLVVSAADDATARVWDLRAKGAVAIFRTKLPATAVAFSADASGVYVGGIDNDLKMFDIRVAGRGEDDARGPSMTLRGHTDTITGVAVSPDGTHVLTNAMDGTLRRWDARPFCEGDRCVGTLVGHEHNFEKALLRCAWSADGKRVSAGSSCRNVHVWDVASGRALYKLPGHLGTVHDVAFHPKEPIIASGGADRRVYLGELAD